MKNLIEELLHTQADISRKDGKLGLPFYLTAGRELFNVNVLGNVFCIVLLKETDNTDIRKLKHQISQYCTAFSEPVAFFIPDLTNRKREALIKAGVPFIAPPGQLYLPFLGIVLSDKYVKTQNTDTKKMSPLEQQVFLWMLYNEKECTKSEIADSLKVTRAAITKVTGALSVKGLITEKKDGKNVFIMISGNSKESYKNALKWMTTPVKKTVCCLNNDACEAFPLAGESALSELSMLSLPSVEVRACYENDYRLKEMDLIEDDRWIEGKDYIKLELWKYDPSLICKSKTVDMISLGLSLADETDERIEGEIQEMMEEAGWQ